MCQNFVVVVVVFFLFRLPLINSDLSGDPDRYSLHTDSSVPVRLIVFTAFYFYNIFLLILLIKKNIERKTKVIYKCLYWYFYLS